MNVSEIMTRNVSSCESNSSLESIAKMMWDSDSGSIPVLDNSGSVVGMITDRDIAIGCALNHKAEWELSASDILNSQPLFSCRPDEDVKTALQKMSQNHVHRLPVIDAQGRLQGILSIDDVVTFAEENNPELSFQDTMSTLKQVCTHH